LEDDDADENMRCKRRGASSPIGFFFSFFFVANFGHLATENKGGRTGAANCRKGFFSGKKGPQSPYFKEKQKKWNSPYLEHW